MRISKVNIINQNVFSSKQTLKNKQVNNPVGEKQEKKYTPKQAVQIASGCVIALLIIPVIFMVFEGKFKLKGFGKLYKQEVKELLDCL